MLLQISKTVTLDKVVKYIIDFVVTRDFTQIFDDNASLQHALRLESPLCVVTYILREWHENLDKFE